jgi:hypothetical protein
MAGFDLDTIVNLLKGTICSKHPKAKEERKLGTQLRLPTFPDKFASNLSISLPTTPFL